MIQYCYMALFCLIFFVQGITGCQNSNSGTNTEKEISEYPKIDTLLQKLREHQKLMGALAISKNSKLEYNKAFGYARMNKDDSIEATPGTRYRIGSITKTFTATIIMQLVEEGKLTLDKQLSEFYPKIPNASEITIENLLRHQSGLYNFTDSSYMNWKAASRNKDELLALFKDQEPIFEPGTETQYSNTNYVLLGYIIESIEDHPYRKAIQKRIAKPLGLDATYFARQTKVNPEAGSFEWDGKKWENVEETNPNIPHGAGALISTPSELTLFMDALFNGKLVKKASLEKMTSIKGKYGMGLIEAPFYEKKAFGHTGGIDGFRATLFHFPEDSLTVALTANALNYSMNDILIGVLSVVFDKDYELPSFDNERVDLSNDQLKKFEGIYETNQLPMTIKINFKDGQLTGQASGQPAFQMQPTSDTSFKYAPADVNMHFKRPESGNFEEFFLHQMGQKFMFKKSTDTKK